MPSKNHSAIEETAILEILQVIEKHGISAFKAERIPAQLEQAIKLQNILLMGEIGFKAPKSQEK